jgi:hypothetical protein
MFELLCICLIASYLFKIKIYSHQKVGIIINSLTCLIIVIIKFIILNNHFTKNKEDQNFYYFNIEKKWFIPISIIIYFFIIGSTSYIYVKLKFYMDLKFISQTKLLIIYGIIGFFFSSIACIIETSFKCAKSAREFFCKIKIYHKEDDDTDYDSYIENIFVFFEDLQLEKKDIIIEFFLFFFGMIFYYCSLYFEILVINYLTPMHFMFSSLIYLFVNELRELINIIIEKKNSDNGNDKDEPINKNNFSYLFSINISNISSYFISLIGFMIYLEIIELNFCKLNYNLRKYINKRSLKDTYEDDTNESIISDNDNYEKTFTITSKVELPFNMTINEEQ